MSNDLRAHVMKQIGDALGLYLADLEAMSDEVLAQAPGGSARSAYDMTYEVCHIHRRIAKRLKGEHLEPMDPSKGWMRAPEEFRNKTAAITEMKESAAAMIAGLEAEADFNRAIPLPTGTTSPLDLASLAAVHLMYHDAQLNYIQSLNDDVAMHWGG